MSVINEALWRALPDLPDVLAKIRGGEYTLHGGVVRYASGTGKGGQIVGHLLFPGDALQAKESIGRLQSVLQDGLGSLQGGISQLQQGIHVLQGLQAANLALSGLNLAVSAAGFVIVCKKLDRISAQIKAQSQGIAQTLQMVGEAHDRTLLRDEARFRSLLISSRQFCEQGDIGHLKSLLPTFHEEYQFTKLVLERHAFIAESNMGHFDEISLLQDRLINMGLALSHVQVKVGALKHGRECVTQLAEDINSLNRRRIEVLSGSAECASRMTRSHYGKVTSFLQHGKMIIPALSYDADLIDLEITYPGALQQAFGSQDIMMLAA